MTRQTRLFLHTGTGQIILKTVLFFQWTPDLIVLSLCLVLSGEPISCQAMDSLLGKGPRHTVSSQLAMLMEGAAMQRIQSTRLSANHSHWLENTGSGVAYVSMCTHDRVQQWHRFHRLPRCLPSLTEHCLKVRVGDKRRME